jgi:HEAT repeat protein
MRRPSPETQPDLVRWACGELGYPDPQWRLHVLKLLACFGSPSPQLETAVAGCLTDPAPEVRRLAVVVLNELGSPAAVTVLARALTDADPVVRKRAAGALESFGERAVEALDALRGLLADHSPTVRRTAASAIGSLGAAAAAAAADLERLRDGADDDITRAVAGVALKRVRGD